VSVFDPDLQEAAIYAAAKAYWQGCQAEPNDPLTDKDLEMVKALAEWSPGGSNAIRTAAIAVLEFMDLRSPDACFVCSASGHSCYVCGGETDHWHEVVAQVRCESCLEKGRLQLEVGRERG